MSKFKNHQLWWVLRRLLIGEDISKNEFIAMKNRLFDFPEFAKNHDIAFEELTKVKSAKQLRDVINKFTMVELAKMYYS